MARRGINLRSKVDRIIEWVFPTVLLSFVPIAAQLLIVSVTREHGFYGWRDLAEHASRHGELIFISGTLVAESIGDIWRRQIPRHQKNIIASLCLVFALAAIFAFAQISLLGMSPSHISILSVYVAALGLVACIFCKLAGRS